MANDGGELSQGWHLFLPTDTIRTLPSVLGEMINDITTEPRKNCYFSHRYRKLWLICYGVVVSAETLAVRRWQGVQWNPF